MLCQVVKLGLLADVGLRYLTFIQSTLAKKSLHGKGFKVSTT
jgi:hypothetical protein